MLTENPTPKSVDHSRAQRASLNLLMHRSNAKVFSVDANGLIDSWSDAMIEFTGITGDMALGTPYSRVFTGENVIVVENIDQAKVGDDSQYKVMKVMSRRGRKQIVLNVLPRYGDQHTAIEGFACVLWDVSDLAEKEVHQLIAIDKYYREDVDTLARDMQRMAEVLEMKRNFVRSVSHEIRTPLNVVLAGLQLIETQFIHHISSEVLSLIKEIKQSCRDGVDILDDLLAYEKLEGKVLEVEKEPVSVSALVKDCIQPFQMQARLNNVQLEYQEHLLVGDSQIPCRDMMIFVDHFKTRQVVRNLISNAIKFTPEGKVQCRVSWREQSTDTSLISEGGFVRIEVLDNGIGISEVLSPFLYCL